MPSLPIRHCIIFDYILPANCSHPSLIQREIASLSRRVAECYLAPLGCCDCPSTDAPCSVEKVTMSKKDLLPEECVASTKLVVQLEDVGLSHVQLAFPPRYPDPAMYRVYRLPFLRNFNRHTNSSPTHRLTLVLQQLQWVFGRRVVGPWHSCDR